MCHHSCKTNGTLVKCIVVLQSRGKGPNSCENKKKKIPFFSSCSPGMENKNTLKCYSTKFATMLLYEM